MSCKKDVNYVMKKLLPIVITLFMLVLSACSRTDPETAQNTQEFSQVLSVQVDSNAERSAVEAQYGGKVIAWYPESNLAILGLYGGNFTAQNVDAFKTPEVSTLSLYNNGYKTWGGGYRTWSGGYKAWGGGGTTYPTTFTENVALWNIIRLTQGQNLAHNLGRGVKVAVIDSGIDLAHPAFVGKLAPSTEWKDFVDGDSNPQDVLNPAYLSTAVQNKGYGHGTSVAGVILQVAPNATILPIRVLEPDGTGDLDKVIQAVDWAIQKGAKVINLSLGTDLNDQNFKNIISVARSSGVAIVGSSGNNGVKGVEYPARYSGTVFAVGSISSTGAQSVFSSYGADLDIMAPGEFMYSAFPAGQIAYSSGTSFASPIIAGSYALALGQKGLTPGQLENAIINTILKVSGNPAGTVQVDAFMTKALK
jgi:thermitase